MHSSLCSASCQQLQRGARRPGCPAASARPATLAEGGPTLKAGAQPAHQPLHQASHLSDRNKGRDYARRAGAAAEPAGCGPDVSLAGDAQLCSANVLVETSTAAVLLPPPLEVVAEQRTVCFSADGHLPRHAQHHTQQQHHLQYGRQLARGGLNGASRSHDTLLASMVLTLQQEPPPLQQHVDGAVNGSLVADAHLPFAASVQEPHSPALQHAPWREEQHVQQQDPAPLAGHHEGAHETCLEPFLDAAGRSGETASTSDPSPDGHRARWRGSTRPGRRTALHGGHLGSARANGYHPAVREHAGLTGGHASLLAPGSVLAFGAAYDASHSAGPGGSNGSSAALLQPVGAAGQHAIRGPATASAVAPLPHEAADALLPQHTDVEPAPPSLQLQLQLPEGDAQLHSRQAEAAARPSRAAEARKKAVQRRRQPPPPTREQVAAMCSEAQALQEALRPRAPTPNDLRLTSHVMRATHWRQVLQLLTWHADQHAGQQAQRQEPALAADRRAQRQDRARAQRAAAVAAAAAAAPPAAALSGATAAAAAASLPTGAAGAASSAAPAARAPPSAAPSPAPQPPLVGSHAAAPPPVSELPLTPQHVAALLLRTTHLVLHGEGPASRGEARQLHGMVDGLARMALTLLPSPGMRLREVAAVFHALVRLRHPVGKAYYVALMTAARRRFVATARSQKRALAVAAAAAPPPPPPTAPSGAAKRTRKASPRRSKSSSGGGAVAAELPYTAHDMAQLLWCVANCGTERLRADWASDYGAALLAVVHDLTPHGVCTVLHSYARLRLQPPPDTLRALCARLAALCMAEPDLGQQQHDARLSCGDGAAVGQDGDHSRASCAAGPSDPLSLSAAEPPGPSACRPVDVALSLWALATLRLSPGACCPQLLAAAQAYSAPRLADFPEQELANLVWALARVRQQPDPAWLRSLYDCLPAALPELRPQALATLLHSVVQFAERPDEACLRAAAARAAELLPAMAPQALALTVHALAAMGYRPEDAWLAAFHARLEAYRGRLDARVYDKVRQAYRMLRFRPGGGGGSGPAAAAASRPTARPDRWTADGGGAAAGAAAAAAARRAWHERGQGQGREQQRPWHNAAGAADCDGHGGGSVEEDGGEAAAGSAGWGSPVLVRPSRFGM